MDEVYKCGWCKQEVKSSEMKYHPCLDLYNSYVLCDKEFFPVDDEGHVFYQNINQNYYWELDKRDYDTDDTSKSVDDNQNPNQISTTLTSNSDNKIIEISIKDEEFNLNHSLHLPRKDIKKINTDSNYRNGLLKQLRKNNEKLNHLVPLQLFDMESNKEYNLLVDEISYKRAKEDIIFAENLLKTHKSAIDCMPSNQSTRSQCTSHNNKIHENTCNSECKTETAVIREKISNLNSNECKSELVLIDQSTMQSYTLFVDLETFRRANKDMLFATQLLNNHIKEINEQSINSLSTDIKIDDNGFDGTPNHTNVLQELIKTYENDISNGEVSNKHTTRFSWTHSQTLLLIHLYKENDSAYSEGKLTYNKFWKKITDGMISKGYNISTTQCISKMDSLKRAYKSIKDHNARSGSDKRTCNYYEELDDLFKKSHGSNHYP